MTFGEMGIDAAIVEVFDLSTWRNLALAGLGFTNTPFDRLLTVLPLSPSSQGLQL